MVDYESITKTFDAAQQNAHLQLADAESVVVRDSKGNLQYRVTYVSSLQQKPERGDADPSKDPLAAPDPALTVSDEGPGPFKLVLNKFPVTPYHTLLVTRDYASQESALTPSELLHAYRFLHDISDSEHRFMCFYNSGVNSGSSLDHKHLQVLPVPADFPLFPDILTNGRAHFIPNDRMEPLQTDQLPFAHFGIPLPQGKDEVTEDLLAMCYFPLLQRALTFFRNWDLESEVIPKSYNMMMTKEWMFIVPRSQPKIDPSVNDGLKLGFNSLAYTGMILVKDQETFQKISSDASLISSALLECGFANTAGTKPNEYDY